jgi:carbon-monoxide dehydrogenase large subunit
MLDGKDMLPASSRHVGRSIRRPEDSDILRGAGRFIADIELPGACEVHIVRSTEPHALIKAFDTDAASRAPGVVAVLTGYDIPFADNRLPCIDMLQDTHDVRQRLLPVDRVRYVGEPVAVVVAEDRYRAEDAAELIRIDYEPLPVVTSADDGAKAEAHLLYPEFNSNTVYRTTQRDGDPETAFSQAEMVLKETFKFHRHFAAPLETRGVLATVSLTDGRLHVWCTTQIPHATRNAIATSLGIPRDQIHVIAPRLGGGFGSKENVYPEEILVPKIAAMLRRPLRWLEDRREHFVASVHAREESVAVEAAVTRDGLITAIKLDCLADIGAAFATVTNTVPTLLGAMVRGPYRVPALDARLSSVVTNKVPLNVFRGAGHPQAVLVMERLLDVAADALQIDRAEIRRRNLLRPEELPLERHALDCIGARRIIYDEGDYPRCFEMALSEAEYSNFERERASAKERGKYLGIGLSNHVEMTAIGPYEDARVALGADGRVTVFSPMVPMGQGPETIQRQIVADELGLPIASIDIRFGSTDDLSDAMGAFASRGAAIGGAVVRMAASKLKEKILDRLTEQLNCRRSDLTWQSGGVSSPFLSNGHITLDGIASRLWGGSDGLRIEALARIEDIKPSYSYATHIAVVEIDTETFEISIPRYVVAHDCGAMINPLLVEGQIVGGVVQGLGGILREHLAYDKGGRLLTTRLMDYVLPGVTDLPVDFRLSHLETPSSFAPNNVRGVGEGGVTGCLAAIATGVADALRSSGVRNPGYGPFLPHHILRMLSENTALEMPREVKRQGVATGNGHTPRSIRNWIATSALLRVFWASRNGRKH